MDSICSPLLQFLLIKQCHFGSASVPQCAPTVLKGRGTNCCKNPDKHACCSPAEMLQWPNDSTAAAERSRVPEGSILSHLAGIPLGRCGQSDARANLRLAQACPRLGLDYVNRQRVGETHLRRICQSGALSAVPVIPYMDRPWPSRFSRVETHTEKFCSGFCLTPRRIYCRCKLLALHSRHALLAKWRYFDWLQRSFSIFSLEC